MRSFQSSRRPADDLILGAAGEQRRGPISTLGFTAIVFLGLLGACSSGQAQTNGMPNSPGTTVQARQISAPQRAQVIRTAQGAKIKITAQRVQPKLAVQRAHSAPAQRVQAKPALATTIGSRIAAKPVRPVTSKIATPVSTPARTAMPIPAPELLAPPPQPNCAFDSARTDADERQKLDYERQCYRHAEMIIRDRLERLQGDVEEMIKAAKDSERVSASR